MAFVLQDVINEIEETRSLEPVKKLKKENLIKVAAHYGITPAIGATKSHILNLIKDHCVENDIIDEVEEKPIAETAEIVRLKLDFEREERRLAREAEKALQDAQFAEAQKDREEAQRARDLRLAELKEARELRELELKAEQEKALLEAEKEAAAREHELKMASLGKQSPSDKASAFDPARNIRLVPPFQEKEVDKYFAHFEKVADSLNWPKESWVLLLQSVLVGKAQEIYGSLSVEQSSNYEHVKEAILKAYELVPEAYRQKFRNYLKYDSKTHVEFAREKENLFNRWCHSKEIGQDFKKLKQMVLLEEFKDKVRPDIRSHLDEQKVEELEKAAIMADDYALTHKMSSKSGNPQQKRYHGSGNRENISRNMDDRKRQGKSTENVGLVSKVEPLKPISCGHCGKPGHIITNCWKLGGKTPCEHCGRFNHKSDNWSDHIRQIERFFQIMREAKLTINLMKSEFGKATVKYLGHIVGQGQVRPLNAKIQTIVKFPIPTSRKELARFLGMAGYYRNFCLNFSEIAAPLTNLLSKKVKFVWTDDCQMAFDKVKLLLQKSPFLKSPDYEKPFKLIIDSSDVGTGSVLVQKLQMD